MNGLINTRELLTAVDAAARHWATNSIMAIDGPGGPGQVPHGDKRSHRMHRNAITDRPIFPLDDGRDYVDTSDPQWKRARDAIGESVLSELKKAGKKIAKSTAKRLLKLAMARLRLKMRTGPLVKGKRRSYRTWQAAQIADKLADGAEEFGTELLDAAEIQPDGRRTRFYQIVSTTRASRTMPFWDTGRKFHFGGRAALRLRRGRPPLSEQEWLRRYRGRRRLLRTKVNVPGTKYGRPSGPLPTAPPTT